jgi:type I restriction enzyme S subunit
MNKDWEIKKLGELLEVQNGYAFSSKDYCDAGHFVIRIGNVQNGYISLMEPKFTNVLADITLQRFALKEMDILVSLTGNVGRVGVIQKEHLPAVLNQRVAKLTIQKPLIINREFLLFFLYSNWFRDELTKAGHGAAQQNISTKDIIEIKLPVPPLSEQNRIVVILNEAFTAINKAKANVEKNLKNAREIFESYLSIIFAANNSSHEIVSLSDLASDITDGDHMPPPKAPEGIPFITISNICKTTNAIDFSDTFKVPHEYFDKLKHNKKPRIGDILYTVTGSFGIPVIVNQNADFCFQRHIGLIRPKEGVSSEWLYYLLKSPDVFRQSNDGATGTAQKTVSLKVLRGLQVPKFNASEQQITVSNLNILSAQNKRLEAIYQQKLTNLEELKKSILQKAFAGELTSNEAENKLRAASA